MVYEVREQLMAWTETDYSKHINFQWKIKWQLEPLGIQGIMGDTAPLSYKFTCHDHRSSE